MQNKNDIWAAEYSMPKRELVVDSIVKDIEEKIANGGLRPGDKLPSESEMCEYYSVGRSTVREAMKVLSAIGLINVMRGDGTYVNDEPSSKLMYPALLSLIMSNSDIYSMMELRDSVEYSAMRLSLYRATTQDIAYCQECLNKLLTIANEEDETIEKRIDADIAFHRAFALATHNKLIIMVHDLVLQFCRPFITQCYIKVPENVKKSMTIHKLMYEALLNRDETLCQNASRENFKEWNETMSSTFGTNK